MKVVGLTGGIGSGKTTVSKVFLSLGVPVLNSDLEGRKSLEEDVDVMVRVKELLGPEVYSEGKPDRAAIAQKVFGDDELLKSLNAIIHPAVGRRTDEWRATLPKETPYCIKEAAILFESGAAENCDAVICVQAPDEIRIARIIARDGVNKESVEARMRNQWPQEKVVKASDHIIDNSGGTSVIQQVLKIHKLLSAKA